MGQHTLTSFAYHLGTGFDVCKINTVVNSLEPNQKVAAIQTVVNGYKALADNFNDNARDPMWDAVQYSTATVVEQNQRLECTMGNNGGIAGWRNAGYISASSYDLRTKGVEVDFKQFNNCERLYLYVSFTKTTGAFYWGDADIWIIERFFDTSQYQVTKRKGGVTNFWQLGAWVAGTGTLRIELGYDGTYIYLYDNDVLKYSGAFDFGTYSVYIGFGFATYNIDHVGMDYLDDEVSCIEA